MVQHYEELDKILNRIEPILLSIAGEGNLIGVDITRWRWDEPDLMLRWKEGDLDKNIHVLIVEGGNQLRIECSASRDKDLSEGKRERKWLYKGIELVSALDTEKFKEKLSEVYRIVAGWTKEGVEKEGETYTYTKRT